MPIEQDRLISLIEFAQQSSKLRTSPASSVSQHKIFDFYEHHLQGLPGIKLNLTTIPDEDEIWLLVDRLKESNPPEIRNEILRPWTHISQSPTEEPRLKESIDGASLIEAETHLASSKGYEITKKQGAKPLIDPQKTIILSEYEKADSVKALFSIYVESKWRLWANEEKLRRRTIRLYSELFTLKQKLEGSIVEAQIEFVWGVGLGVWNCEGVKVSYPLVTQLVELSLNPSTAAIEVRPRNIDARIEVDWYASNDNPGVTDFEKTAKEFFATTMATFSPFDRSTFEPLLRAAVTNLASNGVYCPDESQSEKRMPPEPDDKLRVTDTWVLFARPRTNNLFVQDLEKLKEAVSELDDPSEFPPAVGAIVTNPSLENPVIELPEFRGVSVAYHDCRGSSSKKARDLYFPKPFNDEQVRIIQLLDISDGVVVQGPPGTGKTHTIANIICHYLAEGKRVLVTSMKDPALAVLQEQLPEEIRPLAIALLTSEQEGMKQFEHAIHKIAAEVQGINRGSIAQEIHHLEETIDALHGRLSGIDHKVSDWARKNLNNICLDGEEIAPLEAASEVVDNVGQFEWIPDVLGIGPEFSPKFSDMEITQLREARRHLGHDIDYLSTSLPQIIEFPESRDLLQTHQDLSQFEILKQSVVNGEVPSLADSSQDTLVAAQKLLSHIENLRLLRHDVQQAHQPWTSILHKNLKRSFPHDLLKILESLGEELLQAIEKRKSFITKPVNTPDGAEINPDFLMAVNNLSEGKRAFGLAKLFGNSQVKKWIELVRVLGNQPKTNKDWQHVASHLSLLRQLREYALRWNTLVPELHIDPLHGVEPKHGIAAAHRYQLYLKVKTLVNCESELVLCARDLFPKWLQAREVADSEKYLDELEGALRHHLTKNRLATVWQVKERFQKVLEKRNGRIVEAIRTFLAETIGNPAVSDAEVQSEWSRLMAELSRILGLQSYFDTVSIVSSKITKSGAKNYADLLKQPFTGSVDFALPLHWNKAWRLRRLATHLESIDAHSELKKLMRARREVEGDLARAYHDVVVKRTWLKLAENASPSIRAALQAYLNAIKKIGKGKGKRAVRFRQDARNAAAQSNKAVPCWIMPHYRISESLPPELGCFDLVVIDEASQSDLTALPALLRAKKVLIVGDDKQVSPDGVGIEEEKIRSLMSRFLKDQVETYRAQMSPISSIYDLCKVVFAKNAVMLKEHFRSVAPIIEYSKREFYNHELRPLRVPKASERLDPPLVDVVIENGYRKGDINLQEVRFIIEEIKKIIIDPKMTGRSIGIVSLLADKQALEVWNRLTEEIGPELMQRHNIACGDARTFQGKERNIMFLSMVTAPRDGGAPLVRDTFAQRFNVAASRAKDRMYLVRSVDLEHLSNADVLRRGLIQHFSLPYAQDEVRVSDLRNLCESPFERELYDELTQRGYWVVPQVPVGQYRIDLVVEGHNDTRLAIECDGDRYHGSDKWADDMKRQSVLERAGWVFWRCFASTFIRQRKDVLEELVKTIQDRGIEPIGSDGAPKSVYVEQRRISFDLEEAQRDGVLGATPMNPTPNLLVESLNSDNTKILRDAENSIFTKSKQPSLFNDEATRNKPI
ncbi:MAG: DUF559 domain-containing protein [Deltaproteobacteria bacterium]|nr:DUF559 domain-containing protein [Deltaproteobacteria bacterium]